ncbi:MAG: archaeosortase/exosortase family protein [Saprospiraceae bacterium]|nr:archaeosortase/exosortase family protein [Candidatus Vicinibacter affinis]MBK6573802.1 archaeosortase/exosortase family protein [Candidatus Vicinibacter affinis]MBK6821748.1 archaeosortase/exosortase family protein [Candidatus Vicinibacter affinis]MBK7695292.1 archaeosortase/exosortase family protein [Candidatus Vicinibacter affinis]MBK8404377.1 archaeosortase/exosortase family protein [Candidatus Vicinibacter affinis]
MPNHLTGLQPTFVQKYMKNELIQYAFIMVLVLIVFFLFSSTGIYEKFIQQPISILFASGSANILKLFGYQSWAEDMNIHCGAAVVSISKGCDAIAPIFLSSLAISLFPKVTLQNKVSGILWVVLVLGILNLVRILSLVFSQLYFPEIFDFLHIEFWQFVFLVSSGALFIYWLIRNTKYDPAKDQL